MEFVFVPDFDLDEEDDGNSSEEISTTNFHTGLALLFITGPELTKNKKDHDLFKEALTKLDTLTPDEAYRKLSFRVPLKINLCSIKLYAKELLAND